MLKGSVNDIELSEALKVVADLAESKGETLLSKVLNNLSEQDLAFHSFSGSGIKRALIKRALDRAIDSMKANTVLNALLEADLDSVGDDYEGLSDEDLYDGHYYARSEAES
jgi:hypothetical protein